MSSKPLAPSKDALRTLRFLAYSPSATLIGAGALCGVATLHYHERQKVCRAEEILNTKRKLHTITNGRGSARLACMFEAAERGDDFTIRRGRPVVDLRRRNNSTSIARSDIEDASEWKSPDGITQPRAFETATKRSNKIRPPAQSFSKNEAEWKPFNDTARSQKTKFGRKDPETWRTNLTPEASLYLGSKPSAVRDKSTPKFKEQKQWTADSSWYELAQRSLKDLRKRRGKLEDDVKQARISKLPHSIPDPEVDQTVTDLNPVSVNSKQSSAKLLSASEISENNGRNSLSVDPDSSTTFMSGGFSSLQSWHLASESSRLEEDVEDPPANVHHNAAKVNLYFELTEKFPPADSTNLQKSRYDFDRPAVKKGLELIGADRYAHVFSSFIDFQQQHGREEAIFLLQRTMEQYTSTNKRSDLAFTQAFFLDCTRIFSASEIKPLVWQYVNKFLQGDTPKLEVVRFLYPRCGAGEQPYEQQYYFLAHHYLDELRTKGYDLDKQVTELRKVVAGTHLCGVKVHEHLMIPTLRSLCAVGRMTSAQALLDEIVSAHHIEPTFYTLQILIKGYAKAGNWSRVKSILEECHSKELSQQKAYGSSSLLVSIINDYALQQPVEEVVRFVTHCISTYGLQPVSAVSRQIIMLCLRHRRYDLVVEWIELVRKSFPHILIGEKSNTFAFDMTSVWRDIDSSCEEILAGCKAIASGTLRNPFSPLLRSGISEATARYIVPRLEEVYKVLGIKHPSQSLGQINDFENKLRLLEQNVAKSRAGPRARLLLTDLMSQGQALRELNAICRGEFDFSSSSSQSMVIGDTRPDLTPAMQQLPSLLNLQNTLLNEYDRQDRDGVDINHDNLLKTVSHLTQQDRKHDAFELIRAIHETKWARSPTGREFSLDIFTDWLKIASDLKSGKMLRYVLWAMVDADSTLKISSHILLLARITAPKTLVQKVKSARTNELDEVEYLRIRLKRRRWLNEQGKMNLIFDDWQSFGSTAPRPHRGRRL